MDRDPLRIMLMIDIVERKVLSKSNYVVGEKDAESIAVGVSSLANEQVPQTWKLMALGRNGGKSAAAMSRETSFLFMPLPIGI
jgi:hypothetical protein